MKRWIIIAGIILALGVIGGAGYLGYLSSNAHADAAIQAPPTVAASVGEVVLSVTAPGSAVNTRQVDLSMGVSGQLGQVLVKAGDVVKKGQVLARMSSPETFQAAVTSAELQVLQAQKALDDLVNSAPQAAAQAQVALAQAQKAVTDAQNARDLLNYSRGQNGNADAAWAEYYLAVDAYNRALDRFNNVQNLSESDPARASAQAALVAAQQYMQQKKAIVDWYTSGPSDNDIAQADAALALARANLTTAQNNYDRLQNGPDPQALQSAQYTLQDAQDQLAQAKSNLHKVDLVAPFDGVVTSVAATDGQMVSDGAAILTLTDPKAMEVDATVVEQDFPLVAAGQAVTLYFDALPEANVTGKISRIVPQRLSGAQANYLIAISLDNIPDHLVDGMSADASIVIDQRQNVLRLPRSLVRARSDGTAQVEVWNGLAVEKRTVEVGLKGDSYTEILSGLQAGDLVVAQ
jgi:HlyD family secretion protein